MPKDGGIMVEGGSKSVMIGLNLLNPFIGIWGRSPLKEQPLIGLITTKDIVKKIAGGFLILFRIEIKEGRGFLRD
jgi:hypothetical protein